MTATALPRFSIDLVAAPDDLDDRGHVSNLVYLRWVLEVALAHSNACGWDHAKYIAAGVVFMVRRHEIDYIAQVRAGEALVVETWVSAWRMASCTRSTEIRRGDQVVARAATTWALVAFATGRPQRIPDELRAPFE